MDILDYIDSPDRFHNCIVVRMAFVANSSRDDIRMLAADLNTDSHWYPWGPKIGGSRVLPRRSKVRSNVIGCPY